jgi:hypothetical protein
MGYKSIWEEVFDGIITDDEPFICVNAIDTAQFSDYDIPEFALIGQGFTYR